MPRTIRTTCRIIRRSQTPQVATPKEAATLSTPTPSALAEADRYRGYLRKIRGVLNALSLTLPGDKERCGHAPDEIVDPSTRLRNHLHVMRDFRDTINAFDLSGREEAKG